MDTRRDENETKGMFSICRGKKIFPSSLESKLYREISDESSLLNSSLPQSPFALNMMNTPFPSTCLHCNIHKTRENPFRFNYLDQQRPERR